MWSQIVPVSEELHAEGEATRQVLAQWMNATPEERAAWAAEAVVARAAERAAAVPVPLTLGALLDKLGFDRVYAEHLVQPYCECRDGRDGWDYCQHAQDLGLAE